MKHRLALALRVVAIGVIATCLWFFIRTIQWSKLGVALRDATLWPLVVAAALNFVCLWGKAACWHVMLAPKNHVPTRRLFRYTIAAFATSVIAPARAGEVLRLWVLKRRDGVPIADSAGVAFAEKVLDGATMLVLVAPVPLLLPGLPAWVGSSMLLCGAIALVVLVALYIAVGRVDTTRSLSSDRHWFAKFIAGMHVLRSPKRLLLALLTLTMVWLADLVMVMLVLYAVGIDLPIAAGLLILFTLNLTIMVPSTPAGVGALELGALAATNLLGVAHEPALAFALLYHALQVLPLIVTGFLLEFRLVIGRDRPMDEAAEDAKLASPTALPQGIALTPEPR
ncbi:MAG: hypothetical protein JWO36_1878 [Myxococcales bacterium]|nr:hypothetical protein [Myxococcales bacterium]